MVKQFFHKQGFNNKVHNNNGVAVEFERLAEAQGVIAIDEEKPESKADLDALLLCIKEHKMGVSKIDEAKYEELKKNLPYVKPGPPESGFRIHDPQALTPGGSALRAKAAVSAAIAVAEPVQLAEEAAGSEPQPISAARPVRTSKPTSKATPPMPVAGSVEPPPATTEGA